MAEKSQREKTIMSTYAEVQRCEQNGEYERALKATNRSKLSLNFLEPRNKIIIVFQFFTWPPKKL